MQSYNKIPIYANKLENIFQITGVGFDLLPFSKAELNAA